MHLRGIKTWKSKGAKLGKYGGCGKTFPSQTFGWLPWSSWQWMCGHCHVVEHLSSIWLFLLDNVVSLHLLGIKRRIHCLLPIKQVIEDHAFLVLSCTQYCFAWMKILFCSWCDLFVRSKPSFALLHNGVQAPIFVDSNNSVECSLLVSMSWPMIDKLTGRDCGSVIFVVVVQRFKPCGTHAPNFWTFSSCNSNALWYCGSIPLSLPIPSSFGRDLCK